MRALLIPALVVVLLAGCSTSDSEAPAASSSPSSPPLTAQAAQTATAETPIAPTPTEAPAEATCENLLDPETVQKGESLEGNISQFSASDAEDGGTLKKFLDYGGIACDFAPDQSDSPVLYAYGPITAEQARKEMAHLDELDLPTGENEHGGTYYGNSGDTEIYVFSPAGYWAYQYNNGFGTELGVDAVEEVVANAPAFY